MRTGINTRFFVTVSVMILFSCAFVHAQSINLRFNTYFYGWQRIDSLSALSTAKTTHIRGYQNMLLEVNYNKWSFNTLTQTEEDVINKIGKGFNYRFYNLYIKGSNLYNVMDLKLGRQYVFAGVGNGTVDGLYMKFKAGKTKEYQLSVYGGALTPYTYEIVKYPSIKDNYIFGVQFGYFGIKDLYASLSYTNKRRMTESYTAYRLDSLYNTTTREITTGSQASQLAGFDFNYTYMKNYNFYGKAYYDIYLRKLYRGEFNARVNFKNNIGLFAAYTYRQPQISYNSIFWVFEHKPNQEIEGGVDYTLKNGINIYGKVSEVIYDKAHSTRIQAGFSHAQYGLSFIRYMGYSGESDGVSGYAQREIIKSVLSASVSLGYSRYRLGDYSSDKINSFSGLLGFTYRPMSQLSFDAQGQFMVNRIYKADARFLVGFSYWLFKKL